ncbi:TlpA disulfide reductase family protein [Rubellicoccus peritrichatus]|uniref:TlpA disulfide reductase family protein n=1 Tax=Rubellicoccus peritrichatus TaxID=3080537 RepID=A0AAQ3L8T4_9BACT|nr:TlpA disulfide reductase family protein [Puniceicoccus sp. CR14]WOO41450.1 TlpA disulfide reductase family protein [Puniceicoccus sp. CR14]
MKNGDLVEAELVSCRNGMVVLKKDSGGRTLISLEQFSAESQTEVLEKFPNGGKRSEVKTVSTRKAEPKPTVTKKKTAPQQVQKQTSQNQPPHPGLAKLKRGDAAPPLSAKIQGSPERVSLQSLRGKMVMVVFWSSRAPMSIEEVQRLVSIYPSMKKQGVELIGVSMESSGRTLNSIEEQLGITWPMALDPRGEIVKQWGVTALPTIVVIDQNGLIARENITVAQMTTKQ